MTLNEFKDPDEIADGYAVTVHNHRYSFVSLILSGGYTQIRSDVELRSPCQAVRIRDLREDAVVAGDILEIAHDEFHRLKAIDPGTVTLVVKCPAVKRESISVNTRTLRVATHLPVEERVGQLMDRLQPTSARRG